MFCYVLVSPTVMAQWKEIIKLVNKKCLSLEDLMSVYEKFPLAIREQQASLIEDRLSKQVNWYVQNINI